MSDKIKQDFEEWMQSVREHYGYADNSEAKGFLAYAEKSLWSAWKASRVALVVDLPAPHMCTNCGDVEPWDGIPSNRDMHDIYRESDIREALTKAGVTVK